MELMENHNLLYCPSIISSSCSFHLTFTHNFPKITSRTKSNHHTLNKSYSNPNHLQRLGFLFPPHPFSNFGKLPVKTKFVIKSYLSCHIMLTLQVLTGIQCFANGRSLISLEINTLLSVIKC